MNDEAGSTARLVLASSSPRRREIIAALDIEVQVSSSEVEEGPARQSESPEEYVVRLSREKALAVARSVGDAVVLAADTSVVIDGAILGKPLDELDATRMLKLLRGREHSVITGITVLHAKSGRAVGTYKRTRVVLRRYSDQELDDYVRSGEPMDKAGAYAVQDLVFRPATRLDGCYLNAVGLPLCEVVTSLKALGVYARIRPDWQAPEQCFECPLAATAVTDAAPSPDGGRDI